LGVVQKVTLLGEWNVEHASAEAMQRKDAFSRYGHSVKQSHLAQRTGRGAAAGFGVWGPGEKVAE